MLTLVRSVTADAEGHFKFMELAPGTYYVETTITWGIPSAGGIQTTGGVVSGMVTIEREGQIVELILH